MFSLFKIGNFLHKPRKIEDQIRVFLKWRQKREMAYIEYARWLDDFKEFVARDDIYDVTADDIWAYVDDVRVRFPGEYSTKRAEVSIRQFQRFYIARERNLRDIADLNHILYSGGVNYLSDLKRNKELVELRLKDPKKWTYRALGERFNINHTRVKQILDNNTTILDGKAFFDPKERYARIARTERYTKIERNKQIARLRMKDPKKWAYSKLAERFGVTKARIKAILDKYADTNNYPQS